MSVKNLILLTAAIHFGLISNGQTLKDTSSFGKIDIVGIWQRNYKEAGNGLLQNFRFFSNGNFEVHFSNENEDVRDIFEIKGTYRLAGKKLFLTIRSREVAVGGKISLSESSEDGNIFQITNGTLKEIMEPNPKEDPVPILIMVSTKTNIYLDNEEYYKMSKADLKAEDIDPGQF